MNSKNEVYEIITQKPHGNIQEKNFKKKYTELYQEIINLSFPENFKFTQKLYHFFHDDLGLKLGLCAVCGKRCRFKDFNYGYYSHCSNKCTQTDEKTRIKMQETCKEKYNYVYYMQSPEFKIKSAQTCQEKYGKQNFAQTDEWKEKVKQTCQEKYETDFYVQTDEFKLKSKETCLIHLGVENSSQSKIVQEKRKETNIKKFGYKNPMQNKFIKHKQEQTLEERYGKKFYSQTDDYLIKVKQTSNERYNHDFYSQTDEFKERYKKTCQEKHGVDNYSYTEEFKIKNYNSKKLNNSFNSSQLEIKFKQYLEEHNINYIHQYKSELYPFACDFYLPDYNLYIEINGTWTHGGHPFDENNQEDIDKLNKWIEKSQTSNYYKNAIEVWTEKDVLKRNTAKENKLNYLEIFSNQLNTLIDELNNKIKELEK